LNRIIGEGTLFSEAITPSPWTIPSHASLFTGLYPSQHGVNRMGDKLDGSYVTLAECLTGAGYTTIGASANSFISPRFGFDRGFNEFFVGWQVFQQEDATPIKQTVNKLYVKFFEKRYDKGAWIVTRAVQRWLHRSRSQRPFFLFVNYLDAHLPYRPPIGYRQFFPDDISWQETQKVNQNAWCYISGLTAMTERDFRVLTALYDAEIRYVDAQVGRVYRALQDNGLLEETLLIITSDHGENIGEHDLMDHQYCLYDTLLRVPLIIRYPMAFGVGEVVKDHVSLLDVLPTIVDLLGLNRVEQTWEGYSLLQSVDRDYTLAEYLAPQPSMASLQTEGAYTPTMERFNRQLRCIRTERHKYIMGSDGTQELYDLQSDVGETVNLVERLPQVATHLRDQICNKLGEFPMDLKSQRVSSEETEKDKAIIEQRLRDLGYI